MVNWLYNMSEYRYRYYYFRAFVRTNVSAFGNWSEHSGDAFSSCKNCDFEKGNRGTMMYCDCLKRNRRVWNPTRMHVCKSWSLYFRGISLIKCLNVVAGFVRNQNGVLMCWAWLMLALKFTSQEMNVMLFCHGISCCLERERMIQSLIRVVLVGISVRTLWVVMVRMSNHLRYSSR